MKKILISEYKDAGLMVQEGKISATVTNKNEVLSGGPPTPITYYVKQGGPGPAPYNSPATAAPDLTTLVANVTLTAIDTIELVDSGGTIVDSGHSACFIAAGTIRSWSGNTANATVQVLSGNTLAFTAAAVVLKNFIIYRDGIPGAFANFQGAVADITVDGVVCYLANPGGHIPTGLEITGVGQDRTISSLVVKNCSFKNMRLYGIYFNSYYISQNCLVVNCSFQSCEHAIYLGKFTTAKVSNCVITDCTTGVNFRYAGAQSADYCNVYNTATPYTNVTPGAHCITNDPLILDYTGSLSASSPCLNAGIGPDSDEDTPTTSYNGVTRSGTTTDMGNYEHNPVVAPVANFTATPTSGTFPLTVNFTDTSTNTPTSWAWDFGDGSPIVTDQSPQYIYDIDAGIFTVTLTVTNAGGSDEEIKIGYITVNAIAPTITTQPVSQTVALSSNVTFSVVAVATPPLTDLTYQWQKGDVNIAGATSSSLTLSHVLFTDQNNYRVVVTDEAGSLNSDEAYLTVVDTKKAGSSKNPDDRVGMPKANDEVSGTQVKDTNLGTGYGGNTLELGKINHIGLILRDTQDGSSDGPRARNNENTNGVKGLLPRMAELVQTITTFFYKVR